MSVATVSTDATATSYILLAIPGSFAGSGIQVEQGVDQSTQTCEEDRALLEATDVTCEPALVNVTTQVRRNKKHASRNATSFGVFVSDQLGDKKEMTFAEVCKAAGEKWRTLADEEKKVYRERATKLEMKMKQALTENNKYSCECGKQFSRHHHLTFHINHECKKRVPCPACNKEFTSYRHMKRHEYTVHEKRRHFACKQCEKKFATSSNLKRHVTFVHEDNTWCHLCPRCGRTYTTKGNLKRHLTLC